MDLKRNIKQHSTNISDLKGMGINSMRGRRTQDPVQEQRPS